MKAVGPFYEERVEPVKAESVEGFGHESIVCCISV